MNKVIANWTNWPNFNQEKYLVANVDHWIWLWYEPDWSPQDWVHSTGVYVNDEDHLPLPPNYCIIPFVRRWHRVPRIR